MSPRKKKEDSGRKIKIGELSDVSSVNIAGGNITIAGDSTTDAPPPAISKLFEEIYRTIEKRPNDTNVYKDELKDIVKYIEREASKGDSANAAKLERWLQALVEIAPDVGELLLASFANPVLGMGLVLKKIAEKAKAENRLAGDSTTDAPPPKKKKDK